MAEPMTETDKRFGYRFGDDGIVGRREAEKLLGVSERTVRHYASEGLIRVGYRRPGKPTSGLVVCRRSITRHIQSLER